MATSRHSKPSRLYLTHTAMIPNVFECIVFAICAVLIASLMNMFPICRALAEKKLGVKKESGEKN
ncbi:MAG: hypothetical protein IJU23_10190 [Proteobacteria bacterium]|nr:hypothetical protein [Pseudomonadota bacterium]